MASKKKVTRILPIASLSKVFILSSILSHMNNTNRIDGVISAFDMATLSPVSCNITASGILDIGTNASEEDGIVKMWVLMKKTVHFFLYSQGQFNEYQALPLNDTPLLMEWIGERLFLQFKDRLVEMNSVEGTPVAEYKTPVKNASQLCLKLLSNNSLLFASAPNVLSLLSLSAGTRTSLSLPLPPKFIAYASPFLFIYSDVLTLYDQFTLHPLQQLTAPLPLFLVDQPLPLPALRTAFTPVFLVDKDARLTVPELRDGDVTIHALLQVGSPFTAFDLLRRCQAVGNTVVVSPASHG